MPEKNKAIVRRFYDEVFAAGKMNITAIDQHLTDDFVGHDLPAGLNGRAGYKKFVGMFAASFSDTTQIEAHEIISNGDKIVVRWSSTGRHTGEFMGIPATGQRIRLKGIDIFRLAEGKIAGLWQEMDLLGVIQQISVPPPDGAIWPDGWKGDEEMMAHR
ncbi:MAG: ester cyclase [Chloroflexi bacterium]|nr:ester cyclase [Chloroflexota bacterium]